MTGSFPFRSRSTGTWNRTATSAFHFGDRIDDRIGNPHRTVGSALQSVGYRTAYFGKMHFGGDFGNAEGELLRNVTYEELHRIDFTRRFRNGLLDHGFDYTFVAPDGIQGPLYMWFENDLYRPISDFSNQIPELASGPDSVLRPFSRGDRVGRGEMIQQGFGDSRFDTSEHGPIMGYFAARLLIHTCQTTRINRFCFFMPHPLFTNRSYPKRLWRVHRAWMRGQTSSWILTARSDGCWRHWYRGDITHPRYGVRMDDPEPMPPGLCQSLKP